jgi:Zn finger protein HypA/HybF involved in hydrogenase expression
MHEMALAESVLQIIDEHADAGLRIVAAPGSGWCMACSETVSINELYAACPRCGSHQVQATGGTQMRVKEFFGV